MRSEEHSEGAPAAGTAVDVLPGPLQRSAGKSKRRKPRSVPQDHELEVLEEAFRQAEAER